MTSTTQARTNQSPMRRTAAVAAAAVFTVLAVSALGNTRAGAQDSTEPLVILVSNDDGIGADGIDALVESLRERPDTTVVVSAPAENQSGSSDKTTSGPISAAPGTTKSGFEGIAVGGFPADAVQFGLDNPGPEGAPDLVMTGSNEGQNIGFLAPLSGTVGAAQTGARAGIPALAVSQGLGEPDYPASVGAAMEWLDDHEAALRDGTETVQVSSINAPSCTEGTNRGVVEVPWDGSEGTDVGVQDCTSTLENPTSDVEAFNNGFISLSILPNDFPDAEEPEPTTTTAPPSSTDDPPSSSDNAPSAAAAPLAPTFTG